MENKKTTQPNIHFGIELIVFIIFLILKLDGIIDWKWVWVFSPLWIVWAVQVCIWVLQICIIGIAEIANAIQGYRWKCSLLRPHTSGPSLVWDAKTSTLYGPCMTEDNETEKE